MEIWESVRGYEGYYEVSNMGNVRSVARIEIRSNGWRHSIKSKILSGRKRGQKQKYLAVKLYKNKMNTDASIHILVAKEFIPNPHNHNQVNHKDRNTFNNCAYNLEWTDNKGNQEHSISMGARKSLMKKVEIQTILGDPIMIVRSIKLASLITGAERHSILLVMNGKQKRAKGFKFKLVA